MDPLGIRTLHTLARHDLHFLIEIQERFEFRWMPATDEIQDNFISPFMEEGLFQTMSNLIVKLAARASGDQKQKWV